MVDAGETLSTREKIGYGLGDAGGHCISDLISGFLLFFYTDVFGLSPAIVGAMFFTLRIFDAISDPVMGVIADRTRSRWGRFRPWQHLQGLRKNDQLLLMLVMSFLLVNILCIRGGGYMYFISYALQGSASFMSLFFAIVTVAAIIGAVIVNPLSRRVDMVTLYFRTNLVLVIFGLAMWFLPTGPQHQTLWLVCILINNVVLGFTLPLHFSIMAFADDYGEWKNGVRSSGMNFAFNLFFIKLSWASSGGIISLLLILVAYRPGLENQTAASIQGITLLQTVIPAIFHLVLALCLLKCRLDGPMMKRISTDLNQRHSQIS
ncbi:MFS transporter [Klebsiella oxytoca]|uniref:MFS transporter n=1 Tax=Klebsiella oxytoca TaxID=571 RepID=UPI003969CD20